MKRILALALLVMACGSSHTSPAPTASSAPPSPEAASSGTSPTPAPVLGSGPNLTSVGFSTDGSECDGGTSASSFTAGDSIHTVLTMEPALPTGGTVMVTMERDGVEVAEAGQTITVTEPAPCVWGTLPGLEPGHYRMIYTISPSQMPPASGEFDITPAESGSAAATTSATDTALAKRIIGSLDALAALVVKDDELLTANWVIDEAQWITDNTAALMDQGGSLERFYDEHTALLDIVGAGGDQTEAIGRLLSLRDEIAIEFTLPTLPPS